MAGAYRGGGGSLSFPISGKAGRRLLLGLGVEQLNQTEGRGRYLRYNLEIAGSCGNPTNQTAKIPVSQKTIPLAGVPQAPQTPAET